MTKLTIIDENDKQLTISEVEKNNKNHLLFEIGKNFILIDDNDAAQLQNYIGVYFENQDL